MMFPINDVKKWFLENRRSFPWRENPNPYQVWVSEMMLQQTIASVVISYYERWMQRFPDIKSLSEAPFEEVIKMWEGLGYYARARHLHNGAKYIMEYYEGNFPNTEKELSKIRGIGPYTKGAILSFAFHQKVPAIDGNVSRVISRYLKIEQSIEKTAIKKMMFTYVDNTLPLEESWIVSEALIELGATVCKKNPLCLKCPLLNTCESFKHGKQFEIPQKKERPQSTSLFRLVIIADYGGSILVKKGKEGKVMSHLYEFPFIELDKPLVSEEYALSLCQKELPFSFTFVKTLQEEKHTFTRYRASLYPILLKAHTYCEGIWIKREHLQNLAFSSGHRRLLLQVTS